MVVQISRNEDKMLGFKARQSWAVAHLLLTHAALTLTLARPFDLTLLEQQPSNVPHYHLRNPISSSIPPPPPHLSLFLTAFFILNAGGWLDTSSIPSRSQIAFY